MQGKQIHCRANSTTSERLAASVRFTKAVATRCNKGWRTHTDEAWMTKSVGVFAGRLADSRGITSATGEGGTAGATLDWATRQVTLRCSGHSAMALPVPHLKKTTPLEQGLNVRPKVKPRATPEPDQLFCRVQVNAKSSFKKGFDVFMRKQASHDEWPI